MFLTKFNVLIESPISKSISLFLALDEKISDAFGELTVIKLDSEAKDVERIKLLMELHFKMSNQIHEGIASGSFTITNEQKEVIAKNERQRLFKTNKQITSSSGKMASGLQE